MGASLRKLGSGGKKKETVARRVQTIWRLFFFPHYEKDLTVFL